MAGPQGRANSNQTGGGMGGAGGASGGGDRPDGRAAGPQGRANPNQTGRGGSSFGEAGARGDGRAGGPQGRANPNQTGGGAPATQGGHGGGTFQGGTGLTRDQMVEQDRIGANVAEAQNDYNDQGNSLVDQIGNFLAGLGGFNEMDPTRPGYSDPGAPGQTGRADWGFDPAAALGSAAGLGFGIPLTGLLADQISSAFGRPLEVNLGPDVINNQDGTTTQSGGSMTVHDSDNPNTFLGTSPGIASFAQGAGGTFPTRATYTGVDPMPQDPAAPEAPAPVTPNPSPIDE